MIKIDEAYLEELEAMYAKQEGAPSFNRDDAVYVAQKVPNLIAEIRRLKDGLRFYSDPDLDGYNVSVKDYGLSTDEGDIIKDRGERARQLLGDKS